MFLKNLKKQNLAIFAAPLALVLFASAPAVAADALSKSDVEKIVRDYIQAHPEEILDSVQAYQERSQRSQQVDAVKSNRVGLYSADMTPVAGNPKGDITVVEFFDYNCGYCKKVVPQLMQLIKEDKGVRVLFKEYPILGPTSEKAAQWALAAEKQGKYMEFHRALMENNRPIDDSVLKSVAKAAGLDVDKAEKDSTSTEVVDAIRANRTLGNSMNLRGTPAFVIGEQVAPGAVSLDEMKRMVKEARAAAAK